MPSLPSFSRHGEACPLPPFATLGVEGSPFQGKGSATAAPCLAAPCPPLDALVAFDERLP